MIAKVPTFIKTQVRREAEQNKQPHTRTNSNRGKRNTHFSEYLECDMVFGVVDDLDIAIRWLLQLNCFLEKGSLHQGDSLESASPSHPQPVVRFTTVIEVGDGSFCRPPVRPCRHRIVELKVGRPEAKNTIEKEMLRRLQFGCQGFLRRADLKVGLDFASLFLRIGIII
ncbi:hypothetical protein GW17_00014343 [Ensete ventricosum]|nr:hypothetical protein GW17_00014343 [Ensete ventricosum]